MDKILIILGAGASKDFCRIFPTGLELIKDINNHFLTEKKFPDVRATEGIYLSALMNDISRTFGNSVELFKKIKNELWHTQLDYEWKSLRNKVDKPVSIDNFIDSKIKEGKLGTEAEKIVKYCIYYLIKGTEQAFAEGTYNKNENWIATLAKKLSGYGFNAINENLTVITFNYDRTFDKYFTESLSEHISLSPDQISQFQKNIRHVYGCLGSLNEVPFDLENNKVDIIEKKYERIKLIGDRTKINLPFSDADNYKKVHFIGFGYDDINIGLLNLKQFSSALFRGTAYYYTEEQICDLNKKYNIQAEDISCTDYVEKEF